MIVKQTLPIMLPEEEDCWILSVNDLCLLSFPFMLESWKRHMTFLVGRGD